eukprot:UN07237
MTGCFPFEFILLWHDWLWRWYLVLVFPQNQQSLT